MSREGRASVRHYEPARVLTLPIEQTELAYLGGLIDGDGCITRRNPIRGYWSVKVSMMDKEIIDWLTANVGGTESTQQKKNRTRLLYAWHLSRQAHVREFLLAIAPYLKVHAKQRRALEAIAEIETKTGAGAIRQLF